MNSPLTNDFHLIAHNLQQKKIFESKKTNQNERQHSYKQKTRKPHEI